MKFNNFRGFDEEQAIETIRQAIRSGINYIDTAPYYGQGRSEQVYGKALKGVPREAYYIATKVGRYEVAPKKQFDFSAEKTLKSVDVSLSYLKLDYVDVIQVINVVWSTPQNRLMYCIDWRNCRSMTLNSPRVWTKLSTKRCRHWSKWSNKAKQDTSVSPVIHWHL